MKIHIENLNIHQPSRGLLAMLGNIHAMKLDNDIPVIGDKWQDTDAIYAGISLSKDGDKLVHLLLWPDQPKKKLNYADGVQWAEGVHEDMNSHMPTRHQSIDLFERLQDQFKTDDWHWTLTKTKSGDRAFIQDFFGGFQNHYTLSLNYWVRAVSEIPLQ